jgi:NADH-quinone oxidoreductase subunit G
MGCNIEIHDNRERKDRPHVAGGARVMRLKPRYNPDVNQWWMCDEGRYAYHAIDDNRLTTVQVRDGPNLRDGSWDEAFAALASTIQRLAASKQLDRLGVILSTFLTNEELHLAKTLFRQLGITQVTAASPRPGSSDDLLIKADKSPNTRGAQALGLSFRSDALLARAARKELSVLYVFGLDLVEAFGQETIAPALKPLELVVFQGSNVNATCQVAHLVLPSAVYAEKDGTFTNCQGRVQRIQAAFPPLGEAKTDSEILLELAKRLGVSVTMRDAQSMFEDLAAHEPAFQGLSYETIGDAGALLASTNGH